MSRCGGNFAAVLTPPGAGAIALVRVVGPDALSIIGALFQSHRKSSAPPSPAVHFEPNALRYGRLVANGEVIDDVLVCRIPSQDYQVVDISTHGGIRVVERVLESLERRGATIAQPNELPVPPWPTSSRIDDEIMEAMSRVRTTRAVRFLSVQRQVLSTAALEVAQQCVTDVQSACRRLREMLSGFAASRRLVEGATVAIVGPPNSGKSTLFNALVGRAVTIASPRAGTTRDWVEAWVEMEGVAIRLLDTAGIHDQAEDLERQAIEAGSAAAALADLCIWLFDGSVTPAPPPGSMLTPRGGAFILPVRNKSDLAAQQGVGGEDAVSPPEEPPIAISAATGDGIDGLVRRLLEGLGFRGFGTPAPTFFTVRQAGIAERAISDAPHSPKKARAMIIDELLASGP